MIRSDDIFETIRMFQDEKLDVRTVTLGLNLDDCSSPVLAQFLDKIQAKIVGTAGNLVRATREVERTFGIPVTNKRIAVSPIARVAAGHGPDALVKVAERLDTSAAEVDVDLIGGFSATVEKGMTPTEAALFTCLPEALSVTERVCSALSVASSRAGINMDAVLRAGQTIRDTADADRANDGFACAKLVVFANIPEDNPFMAGATHGVGEADAVINIGVSGPGVVHRALQRLIERAGAGMDTAENRLTLADIAEEIKVTAFRITRVGELIGRELAQKLGLSFGIVDLSLAPTPQIGDSIGEILETMGIAKIGAPGSTAALAMLNDAVKKGGAFASSSVGGLSGAFIPVMEDATLARAVEEGSLTLDKLEAMTSVCSVGLDMIAIPGDTPGETIAAIIADEMAIGVMNHKTTATRIIPVPGKSAGERVSFGGLFGESVILAVHDSGESDRFVRFGGRIPAPLHSLRN
ncbi:MAG: PFL family protein [Gammaproteobacteria bacterium]|nr:PFL family protein [Gammaproteobacteria bacterium]